MRVTKLEVNLNNINYNVKKIKEYIGKDVELMPIVKAYGYGSFINYESDFLNQFNIVGVALLDEAIEVRNSGYKGDIFILYPLLEDELVIAIENGFIVNSSNFLTIDINKISSNNKIRTHIEIETGMGRTGLLKDDIDKYLNIINNNKNIILEGIFTHLSSSRTYYDFSIEQLNKFDDIVLYFENKGINFKYKHAICSGGLNDFKDYLYNMVRIGLILYGYYPNATIKQILKLKPAIKLKTKVTFLKEINKGDSVGYNRNFIAKKKSKIATIPFGFGDGLIGLETGEAYVIINSKKAKIIGICMDNMMLDVTNIDVNINDDVYIWDNELLTIEQVASWIPDLCSYEILSSISKRVEREIIK